MKPDWCGAYKPDEDAHRGERTVRHVHEDVVDKLRSVSDDHDRVVRETGFEDFQQQLSQLACEFPDDANVQKDVAGMRQMSVNYSGLSEKEDRDTLKFLFGKWDAAGRKMQTENLEKYKEWGGYGEEVDEGTRNIRGLFKTLFFEKNALVEKLPDTTSDIEFFLDTPGRPTSAIERVAYVWQCLQKNSDERSSVPRCGGDARRLDVKAADAEAAKLGWNELARLRVHVYAVAAKTKWDQALAAFTEDDKRAGAQFGFKKYGIDHLEEAWTTWEKDLYPAHKALYDRISAFEATYFAHPEKLTRREALYKGNIKDCDFIRDEYVKTASAMKPKNIDDYNARVAHDPWIGYLLEHMAMCDVAQRRPIDASSWLQIMYDGGNVPARGPRFAMHAVGVNDAVEQRNNRISSVDIGAPSDVLYKEMKDAAENAESGYPRAWRECDSNDCYRPEGRIASVKKDADGAMTVAFKKEKIWQLGMECKDSNKVLIVHSDGKVQWERDCRAGDWKQITLETEPVRVYPIDAAMLKPGVFARFATVQEGGRDARKGEFGFPVELRQPSTQKGKEDVPLMYAFVPLSAEKGGAPTGAGKKKKNEPFARLALRRQAVERAAADGTTFAHRSPKGRSARK